MSFELGRRLLLSRGIAGGELRRAVFESVSRGKPFARALGDASPTARELLTRPLSDATGPAVRTVVPMRELARALPAGLCARLSVVPLRKDPFTGTVDLAVVDPLDPHAAAEVAFQLGVAVRAVAAPLAEIERALGELLEDEALDGSNLPPEEPVLPLVRRPRASLVPPAPAPVRVRTSEPIEPPIEVARTPTMPPVAGGGHVHLVLDFGAATRAAPGVPTPGPGGFPSEPPPPSAPATQRGLPPAPSRGPLPLRRPPFAPLTPMLDALDLAETRDELLLQLRAGLETTARVAAIFAARKVGFAGVSCSTELDLATLRAATLPTSGAVADAIARGERIGALDPVADAALANALDLQRLGPAVVLLMPVFVGPRTALVLAAFGMGDVMESSRRARALSTAATAVLTRLLRRG